MREFALSDVVDDITTLITRRFVGLPMLFEGSWFLIDVFLQGWLHTKILNVRNYQRFTNLNQDSTKIIFLSFVQVSTKDKISRRRRPLGSIVHCRLPCELIRRRSIFFVNFSPQTDFEPAFFA